MNQRWANALMVLGQMMDKRKQEREEKMYRDLSIMQNDPTLATGDFGQSFMERFGGMPGAEGLYQSFLQQGQEELSEREALNAYYNAMSERQRAVEAQRQEEETRARFMESVQSPRSEAAGRMVGVPGAGMALEAAERQRSITEAIRQRGQGSLEWQAAAALDPQVRATALRAMQERKMALPKAPESLSLPDEALGAYAMGGSPEQIAQAGLAAVGAVPSVGAQYQAELQDRSFARNVEEQMRQEQVRAQQALEKDQRALQRKQAPPGKAPSSGGDKTDKVAEKIGERLTRWSEEQYKRTAEESKLKPEAPPIPDELISAATDLSKIHRNAAKASADALAIWKALNKPDSPEAKALAAMGLTPADGFMKWIELNLSGGE